MSHDCISKGLEIARNGWADEVADQLEALRTVWLRTGNEKMLRRALLDLLRFLERAR